MSEDNGLVVTPQEVSLPATKRQEREVLLIASTLVDPQLTEEEDQELFIFEAGYKVLHFNVIKEKLSLVVDVVEVFTDAGLGALALGVDSGDSGGGVAGAQAAHSSHCPAADSCSTEQ